MENFELTASKLSKNPLGIIALFIVLVYGIAGLVLGTAGETLQESHKSVLVWFLAIFPFSVLGAFTWLVSKHHTKLYSPSDFRNDEGFIRILSPEEQKKRIENEIKEIQNAEKENLQKKSTSIALTKSNEIMNSLLLAQELAFRELENFYNVSINRYVGIGSGYDTGIDGMFISENQTYIVELKYIKNQVNIHSFENSIKAISEKLNMFKWENINMIFTIILDGEELFKKQDMIKYSDTFIAIGNKYGITVIPKVFLLSELKNKFEAADS